jgi:hypothetical protein
LLAAPAFAPVTMPGVSDSAMAAPRSVIFDRWGNQITARKTGRNKPPYIARGVLTVRKAGPANGMVYIPCSGCDPLSPRMKKPGGAQSGTLTGRNRRNGGSAERGIYAVHPGR